MQFQVYRDNSHQWRWRLVAANNRIIATSGESYINKQDCLHAIDLIKAYAATAPVIDI